MARPYRLQEVEQEHEIPLEQLIPDLLSRLGSQKAVADHLGLSQTTISTWLKDNGYISKIIYVKEEESDANYAPANAG